jgi:hypothetical protein
VQKDVCCSIFYPENFIGPFGYTIHWQILYCRGLIKVDVVVVDFECLCHFETHCT